MTPRCRNCDGHVTSRFARVSGDNDGRVHYCPDCSDAGSITDGAAALPHRKDTRWQPAMGGES